VHNEETLNCWQVPVAVKAGVPQVGEHEREIEWLSVTCDVSPFSSMTRCLVRAGELKRFHKFGMIRMMKDMVRMRKEDDIAIPKYYS